MAVSIEPIPTVLPGYRTETVFPPAVLHVKIAFSKSYKSMPSKTKDNRNTLKKVHTRWCLRVCYCPL